MAPSQNDRGEFLRTEYDALSRYFNTVITFRFTTASFFIAAVALVLRIENLDWYHYLLLLLVSLGAWIVELRNRSLSANLVKRAKEIECRWADQGSAPFFTHMIPPEGVWYSDQAKMLWFSLPSMKFITHTFGLDIVYLSVIAYSGWGLLPAVQIARQKALNMNAMDPIAAVLAFALTLVAANLIKTATIEKKTAATNGTVVKQPDHLIVGGWALLIGAAIIIAIALCRAAYPNVGCVCSLFVQRGGS